MVSGLPGQSHSINFTSLQESSDAAEKTVALLSATGRIALSGDGATFLKREVCHVHDLRAFYPSFGDPFDGHL